MASDQIIDVNDRTFGSPPGRSRFWLRLILPVAAVLVIAGGILAGTYHQYRQNRNDVLALSDDLVTTLQGRVKREVSGYLQPAADAAGLLAALMPSRGWPERGRETLEAVGMEQMRQHDQIEQIYAGRGDGSFVMLSRAADGALDTKIILRRDERQRTTWVRRTPEGEVAAIQSDPDDAYDPRERSWYQGALDAGGTHWSDLYVFSTDETPSITVATPARNGGRETVVGVDLRLRALNDFLEELQATARGRLVIVNRQGQVIAAPGATALMADGESGPRTPTVSDLGNPVLSEAHARARLQGDGRAVMRIEGQRHIVATAPLAGVSGRKWRLLLVAPESAFAGFVAANTWRTLLILGATLLLAAGMAGLLTVQAIRADRRQRNLESREHAHEQQMAMMETLVNAATSDIARTASATAAADAELARDLARAVGVNRAGLWRRDGSELTCLVLYDADAQAYTEGSIIARDECPALFEALDGEVVAVDARRDARTRELATAYLLPAGMISFLSMPMRVGGAPLDFVWLEAAPETDLESPEILRHARLTAGLVALRWHKEPRPVPLDAAPAAQPPALSAAAGEVAAAPAGPGGGGPPAEAGMRTTSLAADRTPVLNREMMQHGDAGGATLYPRATVAVVRLLDDVALARTAPRESAPAIARVVDAAESCARELEIPYIKLMGAQLVVIDGFEDAAAEHAVARVADFALRFREPCAAAFRELNTRPAFSIGLDTGPVMGFAVGGGEGVYNVWGEALDVAANLAADVTAGRIQVSAACYEHLRSRYILRPLGRYFMERVGEMATYDLRASL